MSFTRLTEDLQKELRSNMAQIRFLLKQNPGLAFTKITEIATRAGKRYNMVLTLNFPQKDKINDFDSYGTENLSMVIDRTKKVFPIKRDLIKSKAKEIFGDIKVEDAYMYEGKEGVKVFFDLGRIDVLPHSLHVWCKFDQKVNQYCDWLFENCYQLKPGVEGAASEVSS